MRVSVYVLCLGALAAGCSGGAPKAVEQTTPEKEMLTVEVGKSLMPLAEGNQWVYLASAATFGTGTKVGEQDVTLKAGKTVQAGNGAKTPVDVYTKGRIQDTIMWLVRDDGIFQTSALKGQQVFSPAQPLVKFPIEIGGEFTYSGKGPVPTGGFGTMTVKNRVEGFQEVDTEMGRMRALAVESETKFTKEGKSYTSKATTWWAPKVGIVRMVQETEGNGIAVRQTMRIKGHSLKETS